MGTVSKLCWDAFEISEIERGAAGMFVQALAPSASWPPICLCQGAEWAHPRIAMLLRRADAPSRTGNMQSSTSAIRAI
jgi:hypothetical protein